MYRPRPASPARPLPGSCQPSTAEVGLHGLTAFRWRGEAVTISGGRAVKDNQTDGSGKY